MKKKRFIFNGEKNRLNRQPFFLSVKKDDDTLLCLSFFSLSFFPPPGLFDCTSQLPTRSAMPHWLRQQRGFKHYVTRSKGQISHSTWPRASATKPPRFTSFNWALAFVLVERGARSGRPSDQPLLECAVRGG